MLEHQTSFEIYDGGERKSAGAGVTTSGSVAETRHVGHGLSLEPLASHGIIAF